MGPTQQHHLQIEMRSCPNHERVRGQPELGGRGGGACVVTTAVQMRNCERKTPGSVTKISAGPLWNKVGSEFKGQTLQTRAGSVFIGAPSLSSGQYQIQFEITF